MLFAPANLTYWIFIGIGVILFLLVIFSGGGDDDLDLSVEADGGLDIETDTDVEVDGDGFDLEILGWLGIGQAPLILLLAIDFSVWGVTGWILNLIIGTTTGKIPEAFWGLGGVVFISSLIISLFTGSVISRPLGQIFASFGEDGSSDRFLGCVGTVISKQLPYLVDGTVGQADVLDSAKNLVTVSVALPRWAKVIPHHGQQILIIEKNEDCYLAIAKDSSDEDKWLEDSQSQL